MMELRFGQGVYTDLPVFHGQTLTAVPYRYEILDPDCLQYGRAIGNNIILMDDDTRPHRILIVVDYLPDHILGRMQWPTPPRYQKPIEYLWD